MNSILVKAEWDAEASVWVASSDDVPGLAAQSASIESLRPKILAMIADLVEANGIEISLVEIPVHIVAHSFDRMANPLAA
jgi:predicted RNase H-like HicB family nuclease